MLQHLLQKYPNVIQQKNHKQGWNLLHQAGWVGIAKELIQLKPDLVDDISNEGLSVLHTAVSRNDERLVQFILETRPSLLDHRNNDGLSAFRFAVESDKIDNANVILRFKPDLIDTDANGRTVLHTAVKNDKFDVISLVFANCMSNLYAVDESGRTPFDIAALQTKNPQTIQLFQSHVTTDMAIAVNDACLRYCRIDLKSKCLQHCKTLQNFILPSLAHIVFQYCGIETLSKKRKK